MLIFNKLQFIVVRSGNDYDAELLKKDVDIVIFPSDLCGFTVGTTTTRAKEALEKVGQYRDQTECGETCRFYYTGFSEPELVALVQQVVKDYTF